MVPTSTRRAPRPAAKRKLSFNEKRALAALPGKIEALQAEIAALERALDDAGLHARDPQGFGRTTESYAAKRAELDAAEDDWLALEILREEIEG